MSRAKHLWKRFTRLNCYFTVTLPRTVRRTVSVTCLAGTLAPKGLATIGFLGAWLTPSWTNFTLCIAVFSAFWRVRRCVETFTPGLVVGGAHATNDVGRTPATQLREARWISESWGCDQYAIASSPSNSVMIAATVLECGASPRRSLDRTACDFRTATWGQSSPRKWKSARGAKSGAFSLRFKLWPLRLAVFTIDLVGCPFGATLSLQRSFSCCFVCELFVTSTVRWPASAALTRDFSLCSSVKAPNSGSGWTPVFLFFPPPFPPPLQARKSKPSSKTAHALCKTRIQVIECTARDAVGWHQSMLTEVTTGL